MKNFYYKLGHKKFLMIAAVMLLCGDLFYSWRTLRSLGDYESFKSAIEQVIEQARQQGKTQVVKPLEDMPENYLSEIYQMTKKLLYSTTALFIVIHLIIYVFLVMGKSFSHYYALMLSLVAGATSFLSIIFGSFIYLPPTLTYAFVFMGLLILGRPPQNQEPEN